MTLPAWWKGRMIRLGGSVGPDVTRLGAGMPVTCDVSQLPSGFRAMVPKEIPLERSNCEPPGGVRFLITWRSSVICRVNISMKPDPNMPTVFLELDMVWSVVA